MRLNKDPINVSQLHQSTVDWTPSTMPRIMAEYRNHLQGKPSVGWIEASCKALFYGLWNYDKMINQNILAEEIASLVHTKNGERFLVNMLTYLNSNWGLLDKHRVNKFMWLSRYLLRESLHVLGHTETQNIVLQTLFPVDVTQTYALGRHVLDVYSEQMMKANIVPQPSQFIILKGLLSTDYSQKTRHYAIEKVLSISIREKIQQRIKYEAQTLEGKVISQLGSSPKSAANRYVMHFIELAKLEPSDTLRVDFYQIVAFLRLTGSRMLIDFAQFSQEKQETRIKNKSEERKKKKRKPKKTNTTQTGKEGAKNNSQGGKLRKVIKKTQPNKNKKIMSKRKFQIQPMQL